jgi:carbonic anhydrase
VLQFAVDVLKVKHVIVVGHYGCGGVRAAVDGKRRGLVDHWLHPIREISTADRIELDAIPDQSVRLDRLCELNVIRQVKNVAGCLGSKPRQGGSDAACRGHPSRNH